MMRWWLWPALTATRTITPAPSIRWTDWRSPAETAAVVALARRWQRPTAVLRALDVAARDLIFRHGDILAAKDRLAELLHAGKQYGSIPAQAEALVQLSLCHSNNAWNRVNLTLKPF